MAEPIAPVNAELLDVASLGQAVETVLAEFPENVGDRLIARYGSVADVVRAAVKRGEGTYERLRREGRELPLSRYPLLAAAVFSVQGRKTGVQESNANVAKQYDKLVSYGEVPLDVVAQCRLVEEHLTGLLIASSKVAAAVRKKEPAVPPVLIGMVVPAVLGKIGLDAAEPAEAVCRVLVRGAELAGSLRARADDDLVEHTRFSVMGNVDLVYQLTGYRVAIAELGAPVREEEINRLLDEHVREFAAVLRRTMAEDQGFVSTIAVGLRVLARTVAGDAEDRGRSAEKVFVELHPAATKETRPSPREFLVEDNEVSGVAAAADMGLLTAEDVAEIVLEGLFGGAGHHHRAVLSDWLTGGRSARSQDDVVFLVGRVRRVGRLVGRGRLVVPSFLHRRETEAAFETVRSRVRDAIVLGLGGLELVQAVLPPLWTERMPALHLVTARLRLEFGRGLRAAAKARLVSAVVVRAPAQMVQRKDEPERSVVCPCGGPHGRAATPEDQVCPHRPWPEQGYVENYTTLTEFCETSSEGATRQMLRRYEGFWEEWVQEVMAKDAG